MKNKAFNQTVAFSSQSLDFSQNQSVEVSSRAKSTEADEGVVIEAEASPLEQQDHGGSDLNNLALDPGPAVVEVIGKELNILKVQDEASPSLGAESSPEYEHKVSELQSDEAEGLANVPNQKVYDRFKRTVEINTLELFDGDSNSAGAAWMIRDKDDVIEHRERLGLDNSEFYHEGSMTKKIVVILILVASALLAWYTLTGI